ncbi:MAG: desulfoferrodoxin family protein [Eubacteriales bacterium]|nr:desulfoferrodoxin family protein [Eubacteriales bacterium]
MNETKFYRCKHCGNLVGMIHNSGVPIICCGEPMEELIPGSVDASREKHVPVVKAEQNAVTVEVGSAVHPMTQEHSIQWVYLLTDKGGQRKRLLPGSAPAVTFALADEVPAAVYAYCNLHGLWMTKL